MQPGFDLRIRSMIKALTEAVRPAVDSTNKSALEQLDIVIGSLALLKDQVEFVHWFEQVETDEMVGLARNLAALIGHPASQLLSDAEAAAITASNASSRLSVRQEGNICLREALSGIITLGTSSEDKALATQVGKTALESSKAQIGRERAFIAGTNLDVFHDNLQTMEASLLAAVAA